MITTATATVSIILSLNFTNVNAPSEINILLWMADGKDDGIKTGSSLGKEAWQLRDLGPML